MISYICLLATVFANLSCKSIILGALSLILGQRADLKSLKRTDEKSVIEGLFDISSYHLQSFFEAPEAVGLINSSLILNLNDPCVLETTDWIRPLKYIGLRYHPAACSRLFATP